MRTRASCHPEDFFTKEVTDAKVHQTEKFRILTYSGDSDPSDHVKAFNISMRHARFIVDEMDTGYWQLFVEILSGSALT